MVEDSVKQRLIRFAKLKCKSVRAFEMANNLTVGYINAIRVSIQPDKIQRIASHYPDLNIDWLMTGSGEMLVKNGRFEYRRNKTGRLYSIKIEPEAQEIIERYKGEKYLLNCMDTRSNYKDFLHRTNDALKKIKYDPKDKEPIMPELSTYYSRHSWATYAADNNINDSVISFALGHKASNRVTDIYVRRNKLKVDEANRKVIDYFNSNDIIEY